MEAKTGHNLVLLIAVWRKSTIYCLVSINDYYMAIMTITPSNTPMFCSETWWCLSMGFHIMYTRPGDSAANPRRFNICLAFNFQPPLMRIRFLNGSYSLFSIEFWYVYQISWNLSIQIDMPYQEIWSCIPLNRPSNRIQLF